ncbi:MAG: DUF116 domain-containing protein [Acidobacteriota bacterium]
MPVAKSVSVPPTYDLRALGEGLAIYERLDRLADGFLAFAEAEVGVAFTAVPAFADRAGRELDRREEYYRRTTRERYVVELVACVVMARQFWPEFVARRDTVLILPDCLRRKGEGCKRKATRYGSRCTACDPECAVCRMTVAAARCGASAYFADRDHGRQFRALRKGRYRDLSVLGVACIWMLAAGMRAAEEAGVPSQGVLLNFCGCEHWADVPMVTEAVVERVEAILIAKASLAAVRDAR